MTALRRCRAALAWLALACAAFFAAAEPAAAEGPPRITDIRCLELCAAARAGTEDALIRVSGRRLGRVVEVRFPSAAGPLAVAPAGGDRRRLRVTVPAGAVSGRPSVAEADGSSDRSPLRLRVVDASRLPPPASFELLAARSRPRKAFYGQRLPVRLRYRFRSDRRVDVRIRLVDRGSGELVRTWTKRDVLPYSARRLAWNGNVAAGDPAPKGRYKFRISKLGGAGERGGGKFRLYDGYFPVRGGHGYGGELQSFGAPRSGGRTHQGQDVYAACGTALRAARGGRIQHRAYSDALYGHYVIVDVRGSSADHMYAHLAKASPRREGSRVHTRERIGSVGRTGNARTTPCHLHFEVWPWGWRRGNPIDPLALLKRWDGWS